MNNNIKFTEYNDALNKIAVKSSRIKAELSFKYLVSKIKRSFAIYN